MQTINTTELRNHITEYLSMAEEGEMVIILRHGKPIAKLLPISDQDQLASWQSPALRLKIKGASLSKEILKERQEKP